MRSMAGVLVALAVAMPAQAATIAMVTDTMGWIGEETSDGSTTWPASVMVRWEDGNWDDATVTLGSTVYSGQWETSDLGMTDATNRFFSSDDGQMQLELQMNPLAPLDDDTVNDIELLTMLWAHPDFNDEAPVSFLTVSGMPLITKVVPEPGGLVLALIGLAGLGFARRR